MLTYPDLFLDGRACVSSNVALRYCIFRRFLSTPSNLVIYKLIVLDYSVLQASVYRLGGVYVDDQLISHVVMTSCSSFCQKSNCCRELLRNEHPKCRRRQPPSVSGKC